MDPSALARNARPEIPAPGRCRLWQALYRRRPATVAVLGMSKNSGKTVALNHLLAQATDAGVAVGVTSIGRDGEDRDAVFGIAKPPVRVRPGNVVATARGTLARAGVRYRPLATSGIDSPLGEIVLVRVLDHGAMEIAGASRASGQRQLIATLQQHGCTLVFLDGALGRSQHASPAIADEVVLATGAALGGGIADVLRKTRERLAILGIPTLAPELAGRCGEVFASGGVGVWDHAGRPLLRAAIATLNAAPALREFAGDAIATVAVGGAVGHALWQALMTLAARRPGLTLVVADATRLFVDHADLVALQGLGGRVVAWRGIRVAGVTLNPRTPFAADFAAGEFLAAARRALPGVCVSDVMLEEDAMATEDIR